MSQYPIFAKWSSNKTAINIFLKIPYAWTAEMISYLDFDAITIDLQHGPLDFQEMVSMLQAMNKEKYPMVRLAWNDPADQATHFPQGVTFLRLVIGPYLAGLAPGSPGIPGD